MTVVCISCVQCVQLLCLHYGVDFAYSLYNLDMSLQNKCSVHLYVLSEPISNGRYTALAQTYLPSLRLSRCSVHQEFHHRYYTHIPMA